VDVEPREVLIASKKRRKTRLNLVVVICASRRYAKEICWARGFTVLSSKLITIGCKRMEYSGRGMNRSSGDYSNVKLFGCDAYVFYHHSK
jgi:hypothetical protein